MESDAMYPENAPTPLVRCAGNPLSTITRWKRTARATWLILTVVCCALFTASLPIHFEKVLTFSTQWMADTQMLARFGIPIKAYAVYMFTAITITFLVFIGTGILVFMAKPTDRMALFCAYVLITFGTVWPNTLNSLVEHNPHSPLLGFLVAGIDSLGFALFFWLFYLFPSGKFVPGWTRGPAIGFLLMLLGINYFPNTLLDSNTWPAALNTSLSLGIFGSMIFAQVYRYRRMSVPAERQQTKWVAYSLGLALLGFAAASLGGQAATGAPSSSFATLFSLLVDIFLAMIFLPVPIALGISVMHFRLWDIDHLVNRTLVYVILTLSIIGVYLLIVSYLGIIFQTREGQVISMIAAGGVALLFQPLRVYLQRGINRLMYGQRDEPYTVLAQLGQRFEATTAPETLLFSLVSTIVQTLKLPLAAIELHPSSHQIGAFILYPPEEASGQRGQTMLQLPLIYQAEPLGKLHVAPRGPHENFTKADLDLLKTVANQVGTAVKAVLLTAELQHARESLITAREEERRRIRHDLHDGLGPVLASLALQIDIAREAVWHDPARADTLLAESTTQAQAAITEIRRLIYGLRPPALDEFGLVGALKAHADHFHAPVQVQFDLPEKLPKLPAAVEVAAYRIAQEALTNIFRHAQASQCCVSITLDQTLCMEIRDNGVGLAQLGTGVGISSMRERAEELGGTFHITAYPGEGTQIQVIIPIRLLPAEAPLQGIYPLDN